jgi:hypothetical protein
LRPLFRLHVPRLAGKEQPTATYRSEWHLNTWDFSPDQVVPGKTILEFTGRAAFDDPHVEVPHMTLSFPGADSPLITFGLEGGVQLVYTPGQVPATGPIAMEFAEPTKLAGEAPPEELAGVELAKADEPRESRREDRRADRREAPRADRPGARPPAGLPGNTRPGFDFPKFDIPKFDVPKFEGPEIDRPRIDRPGIDRPGVGRPAAEGQAVNGSRKKETLQCEGEDVIVNGLQNEVVIRGKCGKLSVNGMGNRVTVVEAAEIAVVGRDNVVQYERGPDGKPPRIENRMPGNTVEPVKKD